MGQLNFLQHLEESSKSLFAHFRKYGIWVFVVHDSLKKSIQVEYSLYLLNREKSSIDESFVLGSKTTGTRRASDY